MFLGMAAIIISALLYYGVITSLVQAFIYWFILTLVLILGLRSLVLKFMPSETKKHNIDEDKDAIGSIVEVYEKITPAEEGRVKFRETTWVALSEDSLEIGEKAMITRRDGLKYWVRKI